VRGAQAAPWEDVDGEEEDEDDEEVVCFVASPTGVRGRS
jgi:hypothetical protein